jgi:hypothetical protein
MPQKKLLVDFAGLIEMGWPYTKTHTMRMTKPTLLRSKGSRLKGTYREWVEPNPDPFPAPIKLGRFNNSALVWEVRPVIAWLKRRGLELKGSD